MRNNRALSLLTIWKIENMAKMGIGDVEISKKLNLPYGTVNRYSTLYWKNKMALKDD